MKRSYVDFELVERKPKTNVYNVFSKNHGDLLGRIFWYGPWRQYVFEPLDGTLWSRGCLGEIKQFLTELMEERNAKQNI